MTRMELRSSKINQQTPLQTTRLHFSIAGFESVLDIINQYQKGLANPFVSIQLGGGAHDWVNRLGGCHLIHEL